MPDIGSLFSLAMQEILQGAQFIGDSFWASLGTGAALPVLGKAVIDKITGKADIADNLAYIDGQLKSFCDENGLNYEQIIAKKLRDEGTPAFYLFLVDSARASISGPSVRHTTSTSTDGTNGGQGQSTNHTNEIFSSDVLIANDFSGFTILTMAKKEILDPTKVYEAFRQKHGPALAKSARKRLQKDFGNWTTPSWFAKLVGTWRGDQAYANHAQPIRTALANTAKVLLAYAQKNPEEAKKGVVMDGLCHVACLSTHGDVPYIYVAPTTKSEERKLKAIRMGKISPPTDPEPPSPDQIRSNNPANALMAALSPELS